MTDEDLTDWLETTIMDSIDIDWTPRDAAKLIVSRMQAEGLVLVEREGMRETVAQQLDRDQRTIHTGGTLNRKLSRVLKAHIERTTHD
jgi:hypothetical protein